MYVFRISLFTFPFLSERQCVTHSNVVIQLCEYGIDVDEPESYCVMIFENAKQFKTAHGYEQTNERIIE